MATVSSRFNVLYGTIDAAGTCTQELDLQEYAVFGLLTETAPVHGTLNFLVANKSHFDGGVYGTLRDKDGTAAYVGVGNSVVAIDVNDLSFLLPYRFVRIISDVAQTNGLKIALPVRT